MFDDWLRRMIRVIRWQLCLLLDFRFDPVALGHGSRLVALVFRWEQCRERVRTDEFCHQ
jgi:hypothetical protein